MIFKKSKGLSVDHPLSLKNLSGRLTSSVPYCVLDCEMTGLNVKKDRVISIGAVKILRGRVDLGSRFHRIIRPEELKMTRENVLIHGLGHDRVKAGDPPREVYEALQAYVKDCVLVGHFTTIDLRFLFALARRVGRDSLVQPALDTRKLHLWHVDREDRHRPPPKPGDLQLGKICGDMGSPVFQAHHAFHDALTTACLFIKQLDLLEKAGYYTYGELYKLARTDANG